MGGREGGGRVVRKKEGMEGRVMGGRKHKCDGRKRTHKVEEGEGIPLSATNKLEAKGMTCTHFP